jgi:hypothetical protein
MKRIQLLRGTVKALLVVSLSLGIGVALATATQAQYPNDRTVQERNRDYNGEQNRGRNWDRYGNYGGSARLRQTALIAGYNEGANHGRNAGNQGSDGDYQNLSSYQTATLGYRSRLGDRELYRRYFREAFESGYNDEANARGWRGRNRDRNDRNRDRNDRNDNDEGDRNRRRNWDGYGNFGGSAQLRQTALNAGYNEGNKQGQNDRNSGNEQNYQNQNEYRKGTKDYSSRLGNRDLYRRYFREAYKTGYRDGLNGS